MTNQTAALDGEIQTCSVSFSDVFSCFGRSGDAIRLQSQSTVKQKLVQSKSLRFPRHDARPKDKSEGEGRRTPCKHRLKVLQPQGEICCFFCLVQGFSAGRNSSVVTTLIWLLHRKGLVRTKASGIPSMINHHLVFLLTDTFPKAAAF